MELKVAVSLLVKYEDCKDALDWTVGKHGIIMEYMGRSATFLPEVASEQQWDQRQTLQELLYKAGITKKLTNDVLSRMKLTRYQSSKAELSYAEYLKTYKGK